MFKCCVFHICCDEIDYNISIRCFWFPHETPKPYNFYLCLITKLISLVLAINISVHPQFTRIPLTRVFFALLSRLWQASIHELPYGPHGYPSRYLESQYETGDKGWLFTWMHICRYWAKCFFSFLLGCGYLTWIWFKNRNVINTTLENIARRRNNVSKIS